MICLALFRPFLLGVFAYLPLASALAQTASPTPLTSAAAPGGCVHPFGLDDNTEYVYQLLDHNGKSQGLIRNRVVSLGSETNKKQTITTNTVLIKSGIYDTKSRLVHSQDLTYRCRQDTSFTDGLGELSFESLRRFRDRRLAFAPVPLAWPNQPTVGSELPGGGVTVDVSSSVVDIAKVFSKVQKRRVTGDLSPITTPAGTFSCYKIESEREAGTLAHVDMLLRTVNKVVDYYSPNVGIVKTEVYGKNGKLEQTRVLTERNLGGKTNQSAAQKKVKVKFKE
ncbi:TapB family protein [Hymenobacter crusticola]|uniref:DUF3108 domain-containing protein n=1 Tax=Hymenobacter crusticola TaxID=1770526 RepID=A0A243WFJ0_9BACT|nr:hypothetical protein [Hymenobacter crusticola]OUJ74513.1 hypothetical protein BXP70_06945 [Hymenobacter crusticola]